MIKKRIYEIDILRGIAFLAVVLQHSLAGFIYEPKVNVYEAIPSAIILNIIRFAVPLFVVITGFSLYYSDKGEGYLSYLKKRFNQIILPYLMWTIIYDLSMFFITGMKINPIDVVLKDYIKYVFTGTGSYHLWYMVMIIQFYILSPLFKLFINKNKTKTYNTVSLIVFFILHLWLLYFYNFKLGGIYESSTGILKNILVYRDRLFIMWMFYFVLGAYFAIYFDQIKNMVLKLKYISFLGFLISLCFVMKKMINSATYNSEGGYVINHFLGSPLNTIMFPLIIFSILSLYPLSVYILNKKLSEKIIIIGKYSFGAYLIHALVLRYINITLKTFVPWFYLDIIISFILTSIISIYIIKLLESTNNNVLRKLGGFNRKKL